MAMIPDPRTSPAELTVATVRAWLLELTDVERRIGAQFPRWDARQRAGAYLRGLLSPVERKNGWQLAEVNGDDTPYGAGLSTSSLLDEQPERRPMSVILVSGACRQFL